MNVCQIQQSSLTYYMLDGCSSEVDNQYIALRLNREDGGSDWKAGGGWGAWLMESLKEA